MNIYPIKSHYIPLNAIESPSYIPLKHYINLGKL